VSFLENFREKTKTFVQTLVGKVIPTENNPLLGEESTKGRVIPPGNIISWTRNPPRIGYSATYSIIRHILKGQSHEKIGARRPWKVSLGSN
jgi:hypothetical protein